MSNPLEKRFTKPSESQSCKSLLDAAAYAGHNRDAVRRFLWLINAHPDLVAHAHVFQHIGAMLEVLENTALGPIDGWGEDIAQWRQFCKWADEQRDSIAKLGGLDRFTLKGKGSTGHPLLGEGVGRHGVVTALWASHESQGAFDRYPPPETDISATRYFYLQAHLLRGYIEGRWKFSTLEYFENYDRAKESPVTPALTGAPTLAIREFSHAHFDAFLQKLNTQLPADEFNHHLFSFSGEIDQLSHTHFDDGLRYLASMKRFFRGVARVMNGQRPIRITRNREGGRETGNRKWRTGFIPAKANGVYFKEPLAKKNDPDFQYTTAIGVWINSGTNHVDKENEVELSGLAPSDVLEQIFELIPAEEYQAAMQAERFKRLAIESSAQYFPWGLENLTLGEQVNLWGKINESIADFYDNPPNRAEARYRLIVGLVMKFMMLFGQPVEAARHLRIAWIEADATFDPLNPPLIEIATLYCRRPISDNSPSVILGFGFPAISPDYSTRLGEEVEELSRPIAEGVVFPDLSGLGQDLLNFLQNENRTNDRIFGIEPQKLNAEIRGFTSEIGKRFTPEKIERILAVEIVKQTQDPVLAWLITADTRTRNEARMFYARKPLLNLWKNYSRAASSILRRVGHKPHKITEPEHIDGHFSIGARFVLRFDELSSLCTDLRGHLREWRREPCTHNEIIHYNDIFIFYTYIFQSIATSIRAITQPTGLMHDWINAGCPTSGFHTGIADKESRYFDKSRLIELLPELSRQFHHTRLHIQSLVSRLNLHGEWLTRSPADQLLVVVCENNTIQPLRPGWIENQFNKHLGAKVPPNFHRAFMRFELSERNVPPEIIDAFLGHANSGESPFSRFSTFDYGQALNVLALVIREIITQLGLEPIESRLVPYPTRLALR